MTKWASEMSHDPIFTGHVVGRKFMADDYAGLRDRVASLEGKGVEVIVREHKPHRSSKASRYYFGVVVKLLSDYTGYEPEEMHELLAMKFLRTEDDPITGAPRRLRTPKLNTPEFATYVDQCIRFAAELGVVVPDANSVEVA